MNKNKEFSMSLEDRFNDQMKQFFDTIDFCLENKFYIPSLTLIYSGIDAMAWLYRSEQSDGVTRKDFFSWVEKFMQPENSLNCKAIDLYAARSSILHSFTYESKLTREGKSKQIFYTWGGANPNKLQKIMDLKHPNTTVVLSLEALYESFKKGVYSLISEMKSNSDLLKLFSTRAPKYYGRIPENFIAD